jgi:hypothetical protein
VVKNAGMTHYTMVNITGMILTNALNGLVNITGIILNQRVVNITGTVVSIIRAGGQDASDYTG